MGLLEKNLAMLRRVDEGLSRKIEEIEVTSPHEIFSARDGSLTLRVKGLSLHSAYDPVKEADQQVQKLMEEGPRKGLIIVLGLGLGYHVKRLLEVGSAPIVLVEPDPEIFRIALEHVDLERALAKCRHLFVGKPIEGIFVDLDEKLLLSGQAHLFVHQPSMKLNKAYFERFIQKVKVKRLLGGLTLNILVVPPIYGGSLPVARYCAAGFRSLGHRVTIIDNAIYHRALNDIDTVTSDSLHRDQLRGSLTQHISERTMAKCLDEKPDIVFALAQAPLTPEILDRMGKFDIPTAFWFVEDFREFTYWKQVANRYDHFFAIQKREAFEAMENLKDVGFHYLPLACDPRVHKPLRLNDRDRKQYGSEVSFVGAGYHNRHILFQGLLDFDFKIWGTDWNLASALGRVVQEGGRRVTTREAVKIINGSKVNINLHSSTYHKGINPDGDFVNPRTFEIASSRGFQLIDPRSHLRELFMPGQELVCFESIEDLRGKVAHYLSHPEERERIALSGQKRAHQEHTYRMRMARALEKMVERDTSRFLTLKGRRQTPEPLIAEAGGETELGRFLSRFKGKDQLTLETIVSEIHQGEGKLTEPEAIFLLMDEFSKYKGGSRRRSPR